MPYPVQCACGTVKAELETTGHEIHCVCYCKDCQAFAHFLRKPETILDASGGTEVIQTSSANLRFTDGLLHVACMRLSANGMLRWYANCCHTPIGNTMANSKIAFVGLFRQVLATSGDRLDETFGDVSCRCNGQSAIGERKPKDHGILKALVRLGSMILKNRINGRYRQSPFFHNGMPVAEPLILSNAQRQALTKLD